MLIKQLTENEFKSWMQVNVQNNDYLYYKTNLAITFQIFIYVKYDTMEIVFIHFLWS